MLMEILLSIVPYNNYLNNAIQTNNDLIIVKFVRKKYVVHNETWKNTVE